MVIWKCKDAFRGMFWLGEGVEEMGMCWGKFSWGNLSWGKKISMKGALDFLVYLKKTKKKYEKVFSTESKGQH